MLGKEITTLVNENKLPGEYTFEFDASRYGLNSGIYLYQMQAGEFNSTKKFIYIK